MQDITMQPQSQAFVKLAQSNMDLFTRFSASSEIASQAREDASRLFQTASESAMKLMQSGAYAHLIQGMLKNYTEFLSDFSQGSIAMLGQGQAALTRQVQEATDDIVDATEARGRSKRSTS
jgi:hypothetical protein